MSNFVQFSNGLFHLPTQSLLPTVDYPFDSNLIDELYQQSIFKRFFVNFFGANDAETLRLCLKQAILQLTNPEPHQHKLIVIECPNSHTKDMFFKGLQSALSFMCTEANVDSFSYITDLNVKHKTVAYISSNPTKPITPATFRDLLEPDANGKFTQWIMCVNDKLPSVASSNPEEIASISSNIQTFKISPTSFVAQYNSITKQSVYTNPSYFNIFEEMNTTKFKLNLFLKLIK